VDDELAMVVEFRARPGREADLGTALLAMVTPTRAEDGCLRYDLHVDEGDPAVYAFYEVWATRAHHAAHDRTAHVDAFRAVRDDLLEGPARVLRLTRVEPVEG
jgi:quinol monooxygenase YgiN